VQTCHIYAQLHGLGASAADMAQQLVQQTRPPQDIHTSVELFLRGLGKEKGFLFQASAATSCNFQPPLPVLPLCSKTIAITVRYRDRQLTKEF
jgi:hypothetical protein